MDVGQNKMRSRVSFLQEQATENIDTVNGYFEEEPDKLKGLVSARVINFIKKRKIFVISFLLIAAIGYGVYGKYFNLTDAEIAQKELAKAVIAVSELMILPEGDEPVLATVTDAEALIKQQTFFAGAINGDQLLLFPKNMKAVIYSPSREVIVNVGPIEQQAQQEIAASPRQGEAPRNDNSAVIASPAESGINSARQSQNEAPLTVEVRNGTGKSGLAAQVAENVRVAGFEVIVVADAESKDYKETIVIDLTGGTKSAEAQSIALALGAKVGALPEREIKPEADILVIAGGR